MTDRGIVIFIITLILIRISGRRSFALGSSFDVIIAILLGAVLSRAIVGSSPFFPTVIASFVIVIIHRLVAMLSVKSDKLGWLLKGEKILLYKDGQFFRSNMLKALVSEKDIMEGVRQHALCDDLDKAEAIYMERSGRISVVLKKNN